MKAKKSSKKQKRTAYPLHQETQANELPLLKEDVAIYQTKSRYSEAEKKEILAARDAMINGTSESYTLEEARKLFRNDKAEVLRREENRIAGKSKTYTLFQSMKMIRRKP